MYTRVATPLSLSEIEELEAEGMGELVVLVDGKAYNDEDLHHCSNCQAPSTCPSELDDSGECPDCAEESQAEADHIRELQADWRASRGCW